MAAGFQKHLEKVIGHKSRVDKMIVPGMGMYFLVMALFCGAALLADQYWLAAAETSVTLLVFLLYLRSRANLHQKIKKFNETFSNTMEASSQGNSPLPAVLVRLSDGTIRWANHRFSELTGYADTMMEQNLQDILPDYSTTWLTSGKTESPEDVTLGSRRYRVYGTTYWADGTEHHLMGVLYFSDLTDLHQVRDEYIRSRPVVAIILIDNYEDLIKNLSESAISTLNAKLNETITQWTEGCGGLLRRLERNRFLFVFEKRDLERLREEQFSLLENIHEVVSPSGLPASISIGLGVDGVSFDESYNFAALGIEMALSRGGDQAVIKDRINFNFYGGRSKEAEFGGKVHSRVTANSLMELIGQSSHVFVMGHKNADMDAVGAAAGVCCLCRKKGKKAKIVIDLEKNAAQKLIAQLQEMPEYRDTFISGQEAMLMADNRSILIVVDTNRPNQVEYSPLLETISKVCVVDHHKRAADFISDVVVKLHDVSASSAAELVTEILMYATEPKDVLPVEAKALLAGICLDTKFFNVRCRERTFEAAAVLQRMGTNTTDIKVLLQNSYWDMINKYEIMKEARQHKTQFAIAQLKEPTSRILAAQAADELLNITDITTSFVLYPDGDQVIISARSIAEKINVQLILEPLGGGGNAATAGAQMKGVAIDEALQQLLQSIDQYLETSSDKSEETVRSKRK